MFIIVKLNFRSCHQIYVSVYATQSEHILILKIAAVRPAINLYRHRILTRSYIFCYIETGIIVGTLAVSYLFAVYPYIECAVYTVEMDKYLFILPVGRQVECAAVRTYGIRLIDYRISLARLYERRIIAERISNIRIYRGSVTVHFPVRRH